MLKRAVTGVFGISSSAVREDTTVKQTEPVVLDRARSASGFVLDLVQGAKTQRFPLDRPEQVLGRGSDAELRVDSEELSRRHARFTVRDGEVTCEDLDSKNGVFLNGVRVHSVVLRDGDLLQMGTVVFLYRERG